MGMTHGEPDTYPRTADVIGFCDTQDAVDVAEAVVTVQRDWGDRTNRKHARLKYTIEDRGLDAFRAEVERRAGVKLAKRQPVHVHLDRRPLRLEPRRERARASHACSSRTAGRDSRRGRWTALREIARVHDGDFRITPNQNLIIANVRPAGRARWTSSRARPACSRRSPACGATRWPAWRCRPAAWRWPKANATCPI